MHVAAFILPVHLDIHNKMADNNGTALLHETDFDISTRNVFVELV